MNIIINILITAATIIATTLGIVNFAPMSWLDFNNEPFVITGNLGTIVELQTTDTMSDFPALYNSNLAQLMTMATTSVNSITTLNNLTTAGNLATIGTITTGVWNGTAIGVSKSGTGTTSPSQYQVMLGDGSYGLTIASSTGTAGQFFTSNGAGVYPSWQTSAVNQADNYNWTGSYFGVKNFYASSTVANPVYLNGIDYSLPAVETASSTFLATNGSGALSWNYLDWQEIAATTTTFATTSILLSNIPARTDLKIIVTGNIPSENTFNLQFNGDSTATYGYRQFENYVKNAEESSAATSITLVVSTSSVQYLIAEVHNETAIRKLVNWHGSANSATTITPTMMTGVGVWNNTTAQINKVYIYSTGVEDFAIGSSIKVYGSRY